jgi:hypothetical protein
MATMAYLYKWTQKSTGMWYVGSRTSKNAHLNDGYICSSKIVKPMIKENGQDWEKFILVIGDPVYIAKLEIEYLQNLNAASDPMSYNQHNSNGKFIVTGKIRVNNGTFNKFIDPSDLDLFLDSGYVKGMLETSKKKMKLNHANVSGTNNPMYGSNRIGHNLGYRHTEETKKKMLGPKTSDHKKKLSIAKQGKNNPMFGKKQSPESCEKRSNALKGRIPWNKGIKRGTKSIIGESKGTEIFERAGNPLNQRSKN